MRLKKGINIAEFLKQAQYCKGEVEFLTQEGDHLNLKSTLARYLFVAVSENEQIMDSGRVSCQLNEDYRLLGAFLLLEGC